MARWLMALGFVAICGVVGAGVVAMAQPVPQATCALPGSIFCVDDSTCVGYGAVCDVNANLCVCVTDGGVGDLGLDGGGGSGGGGGGTGDAGSAGPQTPPVTGGGGTTAPKSGCSFVPGAAFSR